MTDPDISLVPVRLAEVVVGRPLQRAIYDSDGKLLLAIGRVIESAVQRDRLIANGFVQDTPLEPPRPTRPPAQRKVLASVGPQTTEESGASKELVVAMDEVRWYVGETLYLQQIDNSAIRYTVRLVGFIKGGMVYVTAPVTDGKVEFVRDGQPFVVRAFSGKKAYAFVTTAMKSIHAPHPQLQLAYPKDVRCTVVRRGVRAQIKIVASVSMSDSGLTKTATLTDLSVDGASYVSENVLGTKGAQGQLKFKVHAAGQDESLNLRVVLRSVAPSESGAGFKHGVEFVDVPTHDRLILSAFVHQTLAEGG